MDLVIQRISQPVGEAELLEFEQRQSLRLPVEYRRFLIERNGGIPANNTEGVQAFFCLGDHPRWSLAAWLDRARGELPGGFCPIAADGRGNVYCIACAGQIAGAVCLWNLEQEGGTTPNLVQLSGSFGQFLSSLEPYDPDDMPSIREEDWDAWTLSDAPPAPAGPPAIKVNVKRRAQHWSERAQRPPQPGG